jgi:hypothetical protein
VLAPQRPGKDFSSRRAASISAMRSGATSVAKSAKVRERRQSAIRHSFAPAVRSFRSNHGDRVASGSRPSSNNAGELSEGSTRESGWRKVSGPSPPHHRAGSIEIAYEDRGHSPASRTARR